MKKVSLLALAAALVLSTVAIAQDTKPADKPSQQPSSSMSSLRGTISSVDNTGKSFVVKDSAGKETTVYWNDATRLSGDLATGSMVVIQSSTQDGKVMASSIQVSGAKKPY
jgi:hypothetical protein